MFTSMSTERVFARTRRAPDRTARSKPCTSIFRRSTDLDSGTRLSSAHTSTCLLRTTREAFFAYCFSKNSDLGDRQEFQKRPDPFAVVGADVDYKCGGRFKAHGQNRKPRSINGEKLTRRTCFKPRMA